MRVASTFVALRTTRPSASARSAAKRVRERPVRASTVQSSRRRRSTADWSEIIGDDDFHGFMNRKCGLDTALRNGWSGATRFVQYNVIPFVKNWATVALPAPRWCKSLEGPG